MTQGPWKADGWERQEILSTVRRFCREVVAPVVLELDQLQDPKDCFSWEIVEKASQVGIRTLTLSPEYGGLGADALTTAMVVEEIAKADLVLQPDLLMARQTIARCAVAGQPPLADRTGRAVIRVIYSNHLSGHQQVRL